MILDSITQLEPVSLHQQCNGVDCEKGLLFYKFFIQFSVLRLINLKVSDWLACRTYSVISSIFVFPYVLPSVRKFYLTTPVDVDWMAILIMCKYQVECFL